MVMVTVTGTRLMKVRECKKMSMPVLHRLRRGYVTACLIDWSDWRNVLDQSGRYDMVGFPLANVASYVLSKTFARIFCDKIPTIQNFSELEGNSHIIYLEDCDCPVRYAYSVRLCIDPFSWSSFVSLLQTSLEVLLVKYYTLTVFFVSLGQFYCTKKNT